MRLLFWLPAGSGSLQEVANPSFVLTPCGANLRPHLLCAGSHQRLASTTTRENEQKMDNAAANLSFMLPVVPTHPLATSRCYD